MNHTIGDIVTANMQRCQCVGGGYMEVTGRVVAILNQANGVWYQIEFNGGIVTVRAENILQ